MDSLLTWTRLVRAAGPVPLDEAAMHIAACFLPNIDVDRELARLDDLAAGVPSPDLDSLLHHLFVTERFHGDAQHSHSPLNSYLPTVIDRRMGLPISLATIAIEVGRRVDVPLVGVGLPGHFLLRDGGDPERFIDAYAGGATLDRQACIDLFASFDASSTFYDRYLDAVTSDEIVGRMLANLLGSFALRHLRPEFALGLRMRGMLRHLPLGDRFETAQRLVSTGRVDWAADVLDAIAEDHPTEGAGAAGQALSLRARMN